MFPDSNIAQKFSCGETKCAYLARFGLAPHFQQLMIKSLKESGAFVVLFDESLNNVTQSKQLDVHIRTWRNGKVATRFLTSEFMGHATAVDLQESLRSALVGLDLSQIVQISMDGPNVNWKMCEDFQVTTKRECSVSFLNIGSCGLHIIHGAFKDGAKATGWKVDRFLSSMYWLFKDTPARREDFVKVTEFTRFPVKFCQNRWLENVTVCETAIMLLKQMTTYLKAVTSGKLINPKTKSFETLKQGLLTSLCRSGCIYICPSQSKLCHSSQCIEQTSHPFSAARVVLWLDHSDTMCSRA